MGLVDQFIHQYQMGRRAPSAGFQALGWKYAAMPKYLFASTTTLLLLVHNIWRGPALWRAGMTYLNW